MAFDQELTDEFVAEAKAAVNGEELVVRGDRPTSISPMMVSSGSATSVTELESLLTTARSAASGETAMEPLRMPARAEVHTSPARSRNVPQHLVRVPFPGIALIGFRIGSKPEKLAYRGRVCPLPRTTHL